MRECAGKTMKGLIPAAGRGSRLEPITLAIPKELLMVGDHAIIEYVITCMKQAGITYITIVVGWRKHAILDYLGSGKRLGVHLTYVVQENHDGLAKAVSAGKQLHEEEPLMVVLGDNFFHPSSFLTDMLTFYKEKSPDALVGVTPVEDPGRHGMIQPEGDDIIQSIVEKPRPEETPSNLGCIGVYLFKPVIFQAIDHITPGFNGEYQLTDAIQWLIHQGYKVLYKQLQGIHIDIGTLEDLRKANNHLLQNP